MRQQPTPLADHVADGLNRSSGELARRWIARITGPEGTRPRVSFPAELFRDHVPVIIESIAGALRSPGPPLLSDDAVRRLAVLARRRLRLGYDVQEVLAELASLGDILFDAAGEVVAGYPGEVDPLEVLRIAGRLHGGLAAVALVMAGTYREQDVARSSEFSRRLSEYMRALAHELKGPLGAAETAAAMLRDEEVLGTPEERRRFTELTVRNLRRARDLIDDIRALTIAEAGGAAPPRRARLAEVVHDVLAEAQPGAERAGVVLRVAGEVPDVEVDATRVEVALANLVWNAIKYADPDKPERWVRIEAEPAGRAGWVVRVADNGLGIPEELERHVFERFFRGHPRVVEGTGLGLAIAREAVEQLGGEIGFESEEGRGSVFWITVPAAESGYAGATPEAAGPTTR